MAERRPIHSTARDAHPASLPRPLPAETFADLLVRYRRAAGLTQEQLAERASLGVRTLGYLERGVSRPQLETLRLLADALRLDANERAVFIHAARPGAAVSPTADSAPVVATPTNLPTPPTPLIGREGAVAEVAAVFRGRGTRLMTITGPGGTGKTRLGIAAARELLRDFPDGVFFVPLAALQDDALTAAEIARAVGVQQHGGIAILDRLCFALAPKRLLLVLDNCEHLPGVMPHVARLLAACPRLAVLATSRAALHAYEERIYPLGPLPLPAAVTLFHERARAVVPDFASADDTAVAEICVRLDGLPLAIELAAARMRVLSPRQVHDRLDHRMGLLTRGPQDASVRHQTMRGAIAWSHESLSADAQRLFRRLAAFAGGWTIAAAAAVCTADNLPAGTVAEAMTGLLDQSLVHAETAADGTQRLGMYETIRAYALEQLIASGEHAVLLQRHVDHYLALVEEAEQHFVSAAQGEWFSRLETEHDNLRAALTWARDSGETAVGVRIATALWRFWHTRGYVVEGSGWFTTLLADDAACDARTRARALHGAGCLAYVRADFAHAYDWLRESALSREIGEDNPLADTLTMLGAVLTERGQYDGAVALQEEALALRRKGGNEPGIAQALNNLANALRHQGARARARQLYEEGIAIRRIGGDHVAIAVMLMNLGQLLQEMGEYDSADSALLESLSLQGGKPQVAVTLNSLGRGAHHRGDYERAEDYYDESLAMMRALGSEGDIARGLINLAQLARDRGDLARAAPLAAESLVLSRKNGHARNTAYALLCTADVSRDQGDRALARARYTEGLAAFRAAGNPLGVTEAIERLGFLAAQEGRAEQGARLLGYSDRTRARMGTPIPPNARAEHARIRALLRGLLDDAALAAAWEAGGALSTDEVIAAATELPVHAPTAVHSSPQRHTILPSVPPDEQTAAGR